MNVKLQFRWAKCLFALLISLFMGLSSQAQSGTYEAVYTIFQETGCANAGCHSGSTASANLDLSASMTEVYNNLVNVAPDNPVAANKGEQLVKPGYPYSSFLFRKLGHLICDDIDCGLDDGEGTAMPLYGGTALTKIQAETIRQWIYEGAPMNGDVINMAAIESYYDEGGLEEIERPTPPPAGKGFQIHLGPIFVQPFDEMEFSIKYALDLPEDIEVNRIDLKMNDFSHHFLLLKMDEATANGFEEGIRPVSIVSNPFIGGNDLVAAWQYTDDVRLPAGTAFKWKKDDVLDLDYHIPNYSGLGVLPSNVYINVYTQPDGTAEKEMFSDLLIYSEDFFFCVPPTGADYMLDEAVVNSQQWNLWMLTSHTHKLGVGYDIWLRDEFGNKGEHIFDGNYDYATGTDLGFYDWSHPPVRYFEPYLELPPFGGFIHEAVYNNPGTSPVCLGLTTENEMFITIAQYTRGAALPFVAINGVADSYCIDQGIAVDLTLEPTGGVLTGPGITGTQFSPSAAGVGVHDIEYTYDDVTAYHTVIVMPQPDAPTIIQNGDELSTLTEGAAYQWYLEGEMIPGATEAVFTATVDGFYMLETVNESGCSTFSDPFSVMTTGIESPSSAFNFGVYPNPFTQLAQISYTLTENSTVRIELYDLTGKLVEQLVNEPQMTGTYSLEIDAKALSLSQGMYFVKVQMGNQTWVEKVVAK